MDPTVVRGLKFATSQILDLRRVFSSNLANSTNRPNRHKCLSSVGTLIENDTSREVIEVVVSHVEK